MGTAMSKLVYYKDANIEFMYEFHQEFIAIHCDVSVWNKSVLRNAYKVFGEFVDMSVNLNFHKLVSFSPNPKFAHIFGGKTIKAFTYEGRKIEVVVWGLKQLSQ
jgi:hypothetical protein